jgi:hypothetical protein
MSDDRTQAAVKATAQAIANDDALAVETGSDPIPADEVIVEPNPAEYVAPGYLQKTAPHLVPAFGELLDMLRDLNARFAGERTVEAQATLSLTGEHEWLEEKFLGWCEMYFKIRGSLDRLSPWNGNDPWRLYMDCCVEFNQLLEKRIVQPGTINSSVLNLSQRFMLSGFAAQVMRPDLKSYAETGRDRYAIVASRYSANDLVADYGREVGAFTAFLQRIAQHLPTDYAQHDGLEWLTDIQTNVTRRAEDLTVLRHVLCVLSVDDSEKRQLAPDLWARFAWDVYHGRSVGVVLTSSSPEPSVERTTRHHLAFRRDGWLCHREYSWLRVQPDYLPDERRSELAVSWYVLDTLTSQLYEAWGRLDPGPVVSRGLESNATDEEQTAALIVALAEPDVAEVETPVAKRPRPPQLRLKRIRAILTRHFECKWSMAKGSEQKVYRQGGKQFTFGCHGTDRMVYPAEIKNCLGKLGIPLGDFIAACG